MRYTTLLASLALAIMVASAAADSNRQAMKTHEAPGLGGYDVPFMPNASYREGIQSPGDFWGYPVGSKPAPHTDLIRYFEYLAETQPNAEIHTYGYTYERRRLVYLVVGSTGNMSRLDDIRNNLTGLADPRRIKDKDAVRVIEESPAVAWMAYGIHGDELSSCDAAAQLAYQLLAGTGEETQRIRDNVIVVIDPLQNPDGRTRWLGQLEQWSSVVPSHDTQSFHHRGAWPYGRTNHYLFDLNRDWFATVHPESRGKTAAILEWMPHYLLDCHEMGPTNTYLFSPPREPFNPYMVDYIHKWWDRVAEEQGAMFDRYGWAYYTREWNEEFFPGYGSSWAIYLGAIGMLFEQAGVDGSQVKRPEGTVMTYRESVHHQFIGSMSNLIAVAEGRKELLTDYYENKLQNVRSRGGAYIFPPSSNAARLERFASKLLHQHIEVERATESFKVDRGVSADGTTVRNRQFPKGTLIVRTNQPLKQLIDVILAFDIRISKAFLEMEKKEILKHHGSKLYEATGWSLPLAYGLDAYYAEGSLRAKSDRYAPTPVEGGVAAGDSPIGYVWSGSDDRAYQLLSDLLALGYEVRVAREKFQVAEMEFPRGSFQVRHSDNPDLDRGEIDRLAMKHEVRVFGISRAFSHAPYANFGGAEFRLLEAPRIAIVGGYPIASYNFGAIWHLLDSRLQLRTSTLDLAQLATTDLAKYNVIVLPNNWRGSANYKQQLGKPGIGKLKDWVRDGGTLIAEGSGASFLADSSVAISSVRPRRQSLGKLALYDDALTHAKVANSPDVDSLAIWEGKEREESEETDEEKVAKEKIKQRDETARRLFPRGAILKVDLDDEHWLTYGCGTSVPVLFNTNYAYLARGDVQVPGRLAPKADVRLAGLLWEEARERWSETAYLTREGSGKGQVILFATLPNFRGYFHGAERLLLNALLLGPGLGARQSIEW